MTSPHPLLRSAWRFLCRIAALTLFLVAAASCRALDPGKDLSQCRMDTWTTRDGLPPREIESMAQTPDGYLWLATRAGLTRFDGVAFTTYDPQNTPEFTRGMITAVAVDQSGTLWVGTDGDGFGTFRDGVYTRCRVSKTPPQWSQTTTICPAGDGSVYVGGHGENNLVQVHAMRVEPIAGAPAEIYAIAQDADGSLWLACGRYGLLHRLNNGIFVPCLDSRNETLTGAVTLCRDSENTLWAGSNQKGLFRVRGSRVEPVPASRAALAGMPSSLCADTQGSVWCGGQDTLARWRRGACSAFGRGDGLAQGRISAMLVDREGSLWAGTGARLSRFNNTKLTPYALACAPGAAIRALAQTPNGDIWIGTTQGLIRQRHGLATRLPLPAWADGEIIQSLWTDMKGVLWIATEKGLLLSCHNGHFTQGHPRSDQKYVADDRDGLILQDWNTLYRLKGGQAVRIPNQQEAGYIFSFCRDTQGTLWLGAEKGLGCVRHNRVEMINQGLPTNTHVLCITQDAKGELWAGTDKGLAHYAQGKLTRFTMRDGLPDDNLYQIACDNQGTLWVGGNRGIFAVKPTDLDAYARGNFAAAPYTLYEAADGIRQFPVTIGGALKMQDGSLWFKGEMGVTIVDPRSIALNKLVPTVKIERVTLDGKTLPVGSQNITVAPGKGELEIRYTGLSLSVPEKVRFHYQLEGFDKGWVDAQTRRAAYYTNLPPGNYRFRVMACNNDGYWNSRGATLAFTLQPRFTQTVAFRVLCILGVCAVCAILAWLRLRKLRRANRRLESRIAERTAQLMEANLELRASHQTVQAANVRLHSLATTDGMTGVANHRAFQETLRTALVVAELNAQPLALLLLDVDHFKQYNDSYGHPAGDEVLRGVARVLTECVREEDIVARYGGEEFAILLPNAGAQIALEIGERVRAAIAACVFPCRCVTMSIGAAPLAEEDYVAETLIRRADEALYAAKRGGRNRVVLAACHAQQTCEEKGEAESEAAQSAQSDLPVLSLVSDLPQTLSGSLSETRSEARSETRKEAKRAQRQSQDQTQTLAGLMAVLNLRDPDTDGHSQRVARFALRIAQEVIRQDIAPLSPDDLRDLTLGALLHDVGKIGVPDAILHKPGALSAEEWEVMRRHPLQGAEMLASFAQFVSALPLVRSHHERWDGQGYPDGLAGESIPLAARIFALADTHDAMSSDRPYRAALPFEMIREEIRRGSGTQFDPALVNVFLSIPQAEWEHLQKQNGAGDLGIQLPDMILSDTA